MSKQIVEEFVVEIKKEWANRHTENFHLGKVIAKYMDKLGQAGGNPIWILYAFHCEMAEPNPTEGRVNFLFLKILKESFDFEAPERVHAEYKNFLNGD